MKLFSFPVATLEKAISKRIKKWMGNVDHG